MLTDQQKAVVESSSSKILVRAGAGTGKTEVLTRRIIRLLKDDPNLTIRNFAVITFTNKATENVRERLKKYLYSEWSNTQDPFLKGKYRTELETLNLSQISTIHKFCSAILDYAGPVKIEDGVVYAPGYRVEESTIYTATSIILERWFLREDTQSHPLRLHFPVHTLRQILIQAYNMIHGKGIPFEQVLKETKNTMLLKDNGDISKIRDGLIGLLSDLKREEVKRRLNTLSMDGLLEYAAKLLRNHPELVNRVQHRFRQLFVDEFQDTSSFQAEILELLSSSGELPCNLFVVGDLKQSVYQFRGADVKSYKNVENWISQEGEVLSLTTNFRSVKPLVNYVNGTFRRFQEDSTFPLFEAEDLEANNKSDLPIEDVVHPIYYDGNLPEERVCNLIFNEVNNGASYHDFAILFRTNRQMESYHQALINAGIPAQMVGMGNLYGRKEISDLFRILNFIVSPQDPVKKDEALNTELINGDYVLLNHLQKELKHLVLSYTVAQIIEQIMKITNARNNYSNKSNIQAVANLDRLKEITRNLGFKESIQLVDYVNWLGIQILTNRDEKQAEVVALKPNAVQLITIHKAKGLEFPYVLLTELDRELSSPSLIPSIIYYPNSGLEFKLRHPIDKWEYTSSEYDAASKLYKLDYLAEEARVLYVAMTRAEKRLYLLINENLAKNKICYQNWLHFKDKELINLKTEMDTYRDQGKGVMAVEVPEAKSKHFDGRWIHQKKAREIFLQKQRGILEMATGTGKTKTAIDIINQLVTDGRINSVVVTVDGTDLLDQWYIHLVKNTKLTVYRHYDKHKQIAPYSLNPDGSAILISRRALDEMFANMTGSFYKKAIIVADEVHGLGSETKIKKFKGKINKFEYTLGLSATPERAYDEEGNQFIEKEIGPVIFEFKLEDAIQKGILCEFDYTPLEFELSDGDRAERKKVIAAYYAALKNGRPASLERLYTDLARIKKESEGKIPVFKDFIQKRPDMLKRTIIFVETIEFGQKIQEIIFPLISNYHTYFGDDERVNLERFSKGEIDCLIAAKRISEGIDIKSVHNIILLTADRAKLQTIQRIGRSLRLDPNNPDKRASVVDFIERHESENIAYEEEAEMSTDLERCEWLMKISNVRRGYL